MSDRRAARPRRHRHRHRRQRRRGAGDRSSERDCDCVVLDLKLARHVRLRRARAHQRDPSACATSRSWCSPAASCRRRRTRSLRTSARSVVVKGVGIARAPAGRDLAVPAPRAMADLPGREACAAGAPASAPTRTWSARPSFVVDDDVRNIFALSSVLERRGMNVLTATTGSEAIAIARCSTPDVAIVLMDIMMPGDGRLRDDAADPRQPSHHQRLPIIALTAKAMKGDRGEVSSRPAHRTIWPSPSTPISLFSVLRAVASPLRPEIDVMSPQRAGQHPAGGRPAGESCSPTKRSCRSLART